MASSNIEDAIVAAIEERAYFSRGNNYKSGAGNQCSQLVIASKFSEDENAALLPLLTELPKLYRDVQTLSELVVKQQEVIIEQQRQMQLMTAAIDAVALARIQTDIGGKLYDHIAKLASDTNLYEHDGGKVTLELKSSFTSESTSSDGNSASNASLSKSQQKTEGAINASLGLLSKLKLSGSAMEGAESLSETQASYIASGGSSRASNSSLAVSGVAVYEHGKIRCDPSLSVVRELVLKDGSKCNAELVAQIRQNPFHYQGTDLSGDN